MENQKLLSPSTNVSFADVAHQTLSFDRESKTDRLVLGLIDTPWVQRLRRISQTGNTRQVYMFAEHSRFGHSLGAAYLASTLMQKLSKRHSALVSPYQDAVAAAALLHDIGHVAPGSHLGEKVWGQGRSAKHEAATVRIIKHDRTISRFLETQETGLTDLVCRILNNDETLPSWACDIISGGGWNADRGNWAIVDSTMCAVSYGRYNVNALLDAFRLTECGQLVIQESRIDALTHFFVARDSMYRQIYQHRVLQAVDRLSYNVVARARVLLEEGDTDAFFMDATMSEVLKSENYVKDLPLDLLFNMTESWWNYHLAEWCSSSDKILSDLAIRLRDRKFFKTIRLPAKPEGAQSKELISAAEEVAIAAGYDPHYYVMVIGDNDAHRRSSEEPPLVLLDDGSVAPATKVEPLIAEIMNKPGNMRRWLAVPAEVKEALGRWR